jgi:pimeloyl-ACP methyl ester carboxylesterase
MATLPVTQLAVYEETGHCSNWERPEQVAADIASIDQSTLKEFDRR